MSLYSKDEELFKSFLKGSQKLADNVGATLGPKGRNVIIHKKDSSPLITKDGVTVAQFVSSEDVFENMAIQTIKQASDQTNITSGDGTTSSTIIANQILKESNKYIVSDHHPFELKKGIDKMAEKVIAKIKERSIPIDSIETIKNVAYISSNGDAIIADLISEAVEQVGRDGAITIEGGRSRDTRLEIMEGFTFDSGIYNSAFITDESSGVCKYNSPLILVTDYKIQVLEELMPVLEVAARINRPLVIIAEEFDGPALAALILNQSQNTMKLAAIKAPRYGEERRAIMQDLCISSGATFIKRDSGLSLADVELKHFGQAKSIESNKRATVIVDPKGDSDSINERIELIKEEIKREDDIELTKRLQTRVTRMASAIAVIKVGANTEVEMEEKKHRVEDALEAVISAQEEGIVLGGGITLLNIAEELKDVEFDTESETLGGRVLLRAIEQPFHKLCENANKSSDFLLERLKEVDNKGYNFKTDKFVDLLDDGVIDPAKVTISCVKNASSAAGTLLTSNRAIYLN